MLLLSVLVDLLNTYLSLCNRTIICNANRIRQDVIVLVDISVYTIVWLQVVVRSRNWRRQKTNNTSRHLVTTLDMQRTPTAPGKSRLDVSHNLLLYGTVIFIDWHDEIFTIFEIVNVLRFIAGLCMLQNTVRICLFAFCWAVFILLMSMKKNLMDRFVSVHDRRTEIWSHFSWILWKTQIRATVIH